MARTVCWSLLLPARFGSLCLALLGLLLLGGGHMAWAQQSNPSLLYRGPKADVMRATVPLAPVNAALQRAGLSAISPNDPALATADRIWATYEVPAPRAFNPYLKPSTAGPLVMKAGPARAPTAQIDTWVLGEAMPAPLIVGLDYEDNAMLAGSFNIPPDPHGAAGVAHVCHVVNIAIQCHTKDGMTMAGFPLPLSAFFGPLSPLTGTFDPKLIYDHFEDRFVVVTLEQTDTGTGDAADTSRILLAVSDDGDPGGTWYLQAIDAMETIDAAPSWFDYPGFAVDEDAIYITGNMFEFTSFGFTGQRLWIVDKDVSSGLYSGLGASAATSYDPASLSGGFETTMQPALMFGEPPAPLPDATEVGTFLVAYSGITFGGEPALQIIRVDDPLAGGGPAFTLAYVMLGATLDDTGSSIPDAPQLDDGDPFPSPSAIPVLTNDRRTLDAVWQADALYTTFTVSPPLIEPDGGEATAHWVQVDTGTLSAPALDKQGNIGGEEIAMGAYTYFPSIAVNPAGDVAIGFSASAPDIFVGAYATGRADSDADGVVACASTLIVGDATYVRTFGASNRWGDYTGMAVDPVDGTFWAINQRAGERGSFDIGEFEDGRWEVYVGKFGPDLVTPCGPLPVELTTFEAQTVGDQVQLTWATATETDNAGFEVQQRTAERFEAVAFVPGVGTTTTPQTYQHAVTDLLPGRYTFRLKQVDYDGRVSFSPEVEVQVAVPGRYHLSEAYPNPFNPTTTLTLSVAAAQQVRIDVYDNLGRRVQRVFEGPMMAEAQRTFTIEAAQLPSGTYFVRVEGEAFVDTRRVTLVK